MKQLPPLSSNVADRLRELLARQQGVQFPLSTKALARSFGVSAASMRTAIKILVAEGLVVSRKGRGIEPASLKAFPASAEHAGERSKKKEMLYALPAPPSATSSLASPVSC